MDYKYDTRQGTHGVSYGAFAQIKTTTEGVIDTSVTVTPMTGLRNYNRRKSFLRRQCKTLNIIRCTYYRGKYYRISI